MPKKTADPKTPNAVKAPKRSQTATDAKAAPKAVKEKKVSVESCSDCSSRNCYRNEDKYPNYCLTLGDRRGAKDALTLYNSGGVEGKILSVAGQVEAEFYGRMTRVEETVTFAKRMGFAKVGVASCFALMNESQILAQCLRSADLEVRTVICKVGSIDKGELGVPDEMKLLPGHKEASCNPVLQAKILNEWGSELNVIMGLCVGHDCLFNQNSQAPVTTLVAKDRVLGHNPAAAFYLSKTFYGRILDFNKYPKSRLAKKK
ncbi:MAG: DUF1847 domain-containing protein [Deltaproteobacteria bacterium]|jgi:uncharacterized metal-binding protein|nr:DUF1847 domain-containing protein [Deltaproteobacteria bacterium]